MTISIHAPRMGSDKKAQSRHNRCNYFNPRSPHGERRLRFFTFTAPLVFQSTLPAWGATRRAKGGITAINNFNPRSPHGERLPKAFAKGLVLSISIHAPRMGSDITPTDNVLRIIFQSTLPAWGATAQGSQSPADGRISIHAPRMGSD